MEPNREWLLVPTIKCRTQHISIQLNFSFLQQKVYHDHLLMARISPQAMPSFSWESACSYTPKLCQGVWQEWHDMYDCMPMLHPKPWPSWSPRASLGRQGWQSVALAGQKMILCMFQTLKEVERDLHPVDCFDHLAGGKAVREEFSVIYLMLCLCAPKGLQNNRAEKGPDSSLDGRFCGNGISWLCIASIELNA